MVTGSRILVTGAAGFVGANMVRRLLAEGVEIHALVRPGTDLWRLKDVTALIRWTECDILDFAAVGKVVAETRPEIVYHFAFPGGYPSDSAGRMNMFSVGLLGTYTLLNAAHENAVEKFVHIGSSTEYGTSNQAHRETDRLEPGNIRGVSKTASTLLCQQFAREFHLNSVILRLFNVYGFWEQRKRLIPGACLAILQDRPLPLTPPGIMHDWVFVEDVVDACLAALNKNIPRGEIINIGSGEQHANEEIVQILGEVAGRELKADVGAYLPHSHDTDCWLANIQRAKEVLGWRPQHSLRAGLKETFSFWQDWYAVHGMDVE